MNAPGLTFSAACKEVAGRGFGCMVATCPEMATGHMEAQGGPHHGRLLAVLCARHASEEGYAELREQLVQWMLDNLLSAELGPGLLGAPPVQHGDHLDGLPDRCLS